MSLISEIAIQIELHSVEGIKNCFNSGVGPNDHFKGVPLIYELTSEYTRSPKFKECVKAFIDQGLQFEDKPLLAVLSDNAKDLDELLSADPEILEKKYTLRCAYTPLFEVPLLHICAEFNHVSCAKVLLKYGADINAQAGLDENGFGGQTPVYHTVNQNRNQSLDMMNFLLSNNANLIMTVKGLVWGNGYEWETFIPAVNPISYAMMGLLPQMDRDELTVAKTVSILLKHAFGIEYLPENVPCAYLKKA